MRLNLAGGVVAALLLVALLISFGSLFTVYQTDQVLVVRLGEPIRAVTEPGLNFKLPLLDSVIYVDKRILDLENPAQEVIASDQKRLVVDAFARYRINDPLKFYQTIGVIEGANARLSTLLNSALRRVLGEATTTDIVRDKRAQLMALVRAQLENEAQSFGISVVDVRIRRANLPEQNSQAVCRIPRPGQPALAGDPRQGGSRRDRAARGSPVEGRADARRGRCRAQPHLRRRLWTRSGFLHVLPIHAGLRKRLARQ
jgi:membrane protease subunit HflC